MMSREAMKLALNKAFQLGQRYWSWADSEYSSHWKKADAAKAEFDQLVQDTINAALAEQPARPYRQLQDNGSKYFGESWDKAEQPAQKALDKMADNARELGLDYEPATYTFKPSDPIIGILDLKPNYNMTFHNGGKQVGELDFNGPEMVFNGDMNESAKVFFDFIAQAFRARLEQERADERVACAKVCDSFQARGVGMQPAECAGAIRARRNA